MAEQPIIWIKRLPYACDICTVPIVNKFFDTKTGPWGCLCPNCFGAYDDQITGDAYARHDDGRWLKV